MKKTLIALSISALATSANAVTIYDTNGTTVELDGSLRLILAKESLKEKAKDGSNVDVNGDDEAAYQNSHSQLKNADSRIGLRVNHKLGDDFYALSRLEARFKDSGTDNFGDLYAKRAYVGLGSEKFGEVTFGRQLTIADDYIIAEDLYYGIVPEYIATDGNSVIRYDYKGIEGLQIGANYNFAENRDAEGEVLENELKNAYGLGATYEKELANGNTVTLTGGVGRSNYVTGTSYKHYQDGYAFGASYTLGDLTLSADTGYKYEKDGVARNKGFFVSPSFVYQVTDKSRVYGNYLYERIKGTEDHQNATKEKTHGFLLGTDYQLHKQVVAYVEGKYVQTKYYSVDSNGNFDYNGKLKDKAIGVGMRVYW